MRTVALPYGHGTLDLHIEEDCLEALVETKMGELEPAPSEEELVRQALAHPIGTPCLGDLARGGAGAQREADARGDAHAGALQPLRRHRFLQAAAGGEQEDIPIQHMA